MRSERGVGKDKDKDIDTIPDIIDTTMTFMSQYGGWGGWLHEGRSSERGEEENPRNTAYLRLRRDKSHLKDCCYAPHRDTHTHTHTHTKSSGVLPHPTFLPPARTRSSPHVRTHDVSHAHTIHERDTHTRIYTHVYSSNIAKGLPENKGSHSHPPAHAFCSMFQDSLHNFPNFVASVFRRLLQLQKLGLFW